MPDRRDFFISYTGADRAWAEWIAWTLEAAGYSCALQAWDFVPGSNFVLKMQEAVEQCDRTIAVLSDAYQKSHYAAPEWAAAFAADPMGLAQKLVPVRIAECQPKGLLGPIVYIDLVGRPEPEAQAALLGGFSARRKPTSAPAFPGSAPTDPPRVQPFPAQFPGPPATTPPNPLLSTPSAPTPPPASRARLLPAERASLFKTLKSVTPPQFNELLFTLDPPAGIVPPMPAPQADRTAALLGWAEGPGGCGLTQLKQILEGLISPP